MTRSEDFTLGDFVVCNFPFENAPTTPAPVRHLAFCAGVLDIVTGSRLTGRLAPATGLFVGLYTSSRVRNFGDKPPPGVLLVPAVRARSMGQDVSFYLDVRRRAWMPIADNWFPRLREPGHGRIGRADKKLINDVREQMALISERHPHHIVNLGPFVPR